MIVTLEFYWQLLKFYFSISPRYPWFHGCFLSFLNGFAHKLCNFMSTKRKEKAFFSLHLEIIIMIMLLQVFECFTSMKFLSFVMNSTNTQLTINMKIKFIFGRGKKTIYPFIYSIRLNIDLNNWVLSPVVSIFYLRKKNRKPLLIFLYLEEIIMLGKKPPFKL